MKRLSGFDTKGEAESAYFKFKNSQNRTEVNKMPFDKLAMHYEHHKKPLLRESSFLDYMQTIPLYITPYFKNKDVFKLKKLDILNWKDWLNEKGLSIGQKGKAYSRLVSVLNFAVTFYDLPYNVASQVGGFKDPNKIKEKMKFWTVDEFGTFIEKVSEKDYQTLFSFLYLTGCRKGEALALRWKDIDFVNSVVDINKSVTHKTTKAKMNKLESLLADDYKITPTKNHSSNRMVYIPENLVQILKDYKQHCSKYERFSDNSFVFGGGHPLPPETIRRKFGEYCDLAKVKHIRIHDLRHSHTSLLLSKGQSILAVAQRLGHSDIEQTLNTYAHFMPDEQKKLLSSINIEINMTKV